MIELPGQFRSTDFLDISWQITQIQIFCGLVPIELVRSFQIADDTASRVAPFQRVLRAFVHGNGYGQGGFGLRFLGLHR